MKQSIELKNLILQWYASISSGEDPGTFGSLFSRQEGFLAIVSEPTEWWQSPEKIIQGYREMAKAGTLEIKVIDLKAYREGTVGWVADRVVLTMPNKIEVPIWHTFILHKENGEWKIVLAHYSTEVPDEEAGFDPA